ncbi:MAG: N-acetyltransferase family protein [Flavitalea sp.]
MTRSIYLHQHNMSLQYRSAVMDDLSRIVEIYNSIIPGRMVTAETNPVSVDSRIPWFNAHNSTHRPLWMVFLEKENVGWVSYQSFYGRSAYNATAELSIYLDEKFRGRGLGREVINYAMESCKALEIKTLLGFIFAHNLPSIELFKRAGFEQWGYYPGIAELDNIERDVVIVGKRINL